jgi:hypothetical protein
MLTNSRELVRQRREQQTAEAESRQPQPPVPLPDVLQQARAAEMQRRKAIMLDALVRRMIEPDAPQQQPTTKPGLVGLE